LRLTDQSRAVVRDATVTAKNVVAGVTLTARTNGAGFYSFSSLTVGIN